MELTQETVVVITGASSGIGAATARRFAREGARVVLAARRAERLAEIAQELRQSGATALAIPTDVTDPEQARRLIEQTLEHFGRLDVLINNAGRGYVGAVEETTPEMLLRMFAVNAFALWYVTAPALPVMKAQRRGHIIVISSVVGRWGYPYSSAYVAAKHAAVGFVAALRTELVGTGVEASVVCPAAVDTDWGKVTEGGPLGDLYIAGIRRSKAIAAERGLPLAPLSRILSPDDIAEQLVQLVRSPRSDLFTHPGTAELAELAARDREALEQQMLSFYLGVQQVYAEWRRNAVPE